MLRAQSSPAPKPGLFLLQKDVSTEALPLLKISLPGLRFSGCYFGKELFPQQFCLMQGLLWPPRSSPSFRSSPPACGSGHSICPVWLHSPSFLGRSLTLLPCKHLSWFDFLGFQHKPVLFFAFASDRKIGEQRSGLLALQVVDSTWLSLFIHEFFLCCKLRRLAWLKGSSRCSSGTHLGHKEGPNVVSALVIFVFTLPMRIPQSTLPPSYFLNKRINIVNKVE